MRVWGGGVEWKFFRRGECVLKKFIGLSFSLGRTWERRNINLLPHPFLSFSTFLIIRRRRVDTPHMGRPCLFWSML